MESAKYKGSPLSFISTIITVMETFFFSAKPSINTRQYEESKDVRIPTCTIFLHQINHLKLCSRQAIPYADCCSGKICEEINKGGEKLILPVQSSSLSEPEGQYLKVVTLFLLDHQTSFFPAATSEKKGEEGGKLLKSWERTLPQKV